VDRDVNKCDEKIARSVVEQIQAAVDESIGTGRPDPLLRCFEDAEAVVIGSSAYRAGTEAIREYFSALAAGASLLRWDLDHPDVFLSEEDVIGFCAEGEVEWADERESGRDPFRLTIVARRTEHGWSVLHFHGSIPES
jgi:hypothetical protein